MGLRRYGWTLLVLTIGCGPSPQTERARHLRAAASWASAVAFTIEQGDAGDVPRWTVRDVVSRAAEETATLQHELEAEARQAGPDARDADVARLVAMLQAAQARPLVPGDLRAIARKVDPR